MWDHLKGKPGEWARGGWDESAEPIIRGDGREAMDKWKQQVAVVVMIMVVAMMQL